MDILDRLRSSDEHSMQRVMGSRIFGEAADEVERLRKIEAAAKNLVAQKGRHHTEQAYQRLAALLVPNDLELTRAEGVGVE